jgi:hypothetical protein
LIQVRRAEKGKKNDPEKPVLGGNNGRRLEVDDNVEQEDFST